ncbi:hypothetical protein AAMO2058_000366700 [Amorphochlora amoebiformis]
MRQLNISPSLSREGLIESVPELRVDDVLEEPRIFESQEMEKMGKMEKMTSSLQIATSSKTAEGNDEEKIRQFFFRRFHSRYQPLPGSIFSALERLCKDSSESDWKRRFTDGCFKDFDVGNLSALLRTSPDKAMADGIFRSLPRVCATHNADSKRPSAPHEELKALMWHVVSVGTSKNLNSNEFKEYVKGEGIAKEIAEHLIDVHLMYRLGVET